MTTRSLASSFLRLRSRSANRAPPARVHTFYRRCRRPRRRRYRCRCWKRCIYANTCRSEKEKDRTSGEIPRRFCFIDHALKWPPAISRFNIVLISGATDFVRSCVYRLPASAHGCQFTRRDRGKFIIDSRDSVRYDVFYTRRERTSSRVSATTNAKRRKLFT